MRGFCPFVAPFGRVVGKGLRQGSAPNLGKFGCSWSENRNGADRFQPLKRKLAGTIGFRGRRGTRATIRSGYVWGSKVRPAKGTGTRKLRLD